MGPSLSSVIPPPVTAEVVAGEAPELPDERRRPACNGPDWKMVSTPDAVGRAVDGGARATTWATDAPSSWVLGT